MLSSISSRRARRESDLFTVVCCLWRCSLQRLLHEMRDGRTIARKYRHILRGSLGKPLVFFRDEADISDDDQREHSGSINESLRSLIHAKLRFDEQISSRETKLAMLSMRCSYCTFMAPREIFPESQVFSAWRIIIERSGNIPPNNMAIDPVLRALAKG